MTTDEYHRPVLLQRAVEELNIKNGAIYVDATFGGGGHSRLILKTMKQGRLIAFDQDSDVKDQLPADERFVFVEHNFKHLQRMLQLHRAIPVHGILADLGVSSHQINAGSRGFSIRFDAPLDMRMDTSSKLTAADIINSYSEHDLANVFYQYGEIRNSRALAKAIVNTRANDKLLSTLQLVNVLKSFAGKNPTQFLAKAFQALRIEVNQELEALKLFLQQSVDVLDKGGHLVVIAYHSLEDRLVKSFMKYGNFNNEATRDLYGNTHNPLKQLYSKPITPTNLELKQNPRARSAKMRVAVKTL